MKSAFLALALTLSCSVAAFAGTCQSTTYDQYLGAGFSCTIADQTYSNFGYVGTSNPPGQGIPAGSVNVTPLSNNGFGPGIQFSAGWLASTVTGVLEQDSLFEFTVNSNTPITDLTLAIGGASFTGTGEIIVSEQACLGGTFSGGACSSGNTVSLSVFDDSAGSQLQDTVNFTGVNEVSVEKDLTVAAGTNGQASVSVLSDNFSEGTSTVPEPGTLSMLGVGGLALLGFARRKLNL
jgi:hypothetical protein